MESSTAQFLMRQFACVQLPKHNAHDSWVALLKKGRQSAAIWSQRFKKSIPYVTLHVPCKLAIAGGSCVSLSPKWGLAGETQVAVLCPADCVEGLP